MSLDPTTPATIVGGVAAQLRFDALHYGVLWRITFLAHSEANELADALLCPLAPTEEARRALLEGREQVPSGAVTSEAEDGGVAGEPSPAVAEASVAPPPVDASSSSSSAKKAPSKKEQQAAEQKAAEQKAQRDWATRHSTSCTPSSCKEKEQKRK